MTLGKRFLHKDFNFKEIPRFRFFVGLILGVIFAFSFYSFLYLFREIFRVFSTTFNHELLILNEKEVHFYNLFFAFISVINAQSIVITFWLERPRSFFNNDNIKKTSIINDQRGFNWYFLCWFSKLAIVIGLFFCITVPGDLYSLNLYPDYTFLFYLIIIVLFFNTWNTIRLVFKNQSLKWLLISIIIVTTLSFGLSKVNLIDYKLINRTILKNNVFYNYNLELPESDFYLKLQNKYLVENIYVVKSNDKIGLEPIIIINKEEISLNKLSNKIKELQSYRYEYDIPYINYRLSIDKEIEMKFIHQIKNELSKVNALNISFAILPKNDKNNKYSRYEYSINYKLPCLMAIKPDYNVIKQTKYLIDIKNQNNGFFNVNDSTICFQDLAFFIKSNIFHNSNYIICYHINNNVSFELYIKMMSYIQMAIKELRNDYSIQQYSKAFGDLNDDEQREVVSKFPLRYWEISNEIDKLYNQK